MNHIIIRTQNSSPASQDYYYHFIIITGTASITLIIHSAYLPKYATTPSTSTCRTLLIDYSPWIMMMVLSKHTFFSSIDYDILACLCCVFIFSGSFFIIHQLVIIESNYHYHYGLCFALFLLYVYHAYHIMLC